MEEAFLYYERAQSGLGERFLFELEKEYNKIRKHSQLYGFINGNKKIRDVKVEHFPYQVVYEVIKNFVVVFSVFSSD